MPNDAYTLSFLSNELNEKLKNGKINKINQPESDEITLNIYAQNKAHKLLISVGSLPRIHLTETVKENPLTSFNFLMSLRKHILNSEIIKISQVPYERIIIIELKSFSELKDSETFYLYIELMGKYSNLILADKNNKILSAIKTSSLDSSRPVFIGLLYDYPPALDNCRFDETGKIKEKLSENFEGNLQNYLCKILKGVAKSTVNEIIYFSKVKNEKLTKADIENLIETIKEFDDKAKNNKTFPCLIYTDNSADAYPFEYKGLNGTTEKFESLNQAFDLLHSKKDNTKRIEEKGKTVRQTVKGNIEKLNKKINLLKIRLVECSEREEFKIYGDLITSNIYKISKGDEILICQNYFNENKEIKIKLDKNLAPSKNAQNYYKKYNKLKTAEGYAVGQLKQAEELLEYFLSIEYALNNCTETLELNEIIEELKKEGFLAENKTAKKPKAKELSFKLTAYKISDFTIYAGRNNLQNDYLTFKIAKPSDIWLHAKGHGSHVIISTENKTVPDKVVEIAAEIAAYNSENKNSSKVTVDYVLKKYVKKPAGAKPGFVVYTDYKSLVTKPNEYKNFRISQESH